MKVTVRYNRWDETGRSLHIYVEFGGITKRLAMVSQDISLRDRKPTEVSVSWYAIGSVPPQYALVMAEALKEAHRISCEMEQCKVWDRITPPFEGAHWKNKGRMPDVHIKDGRAWVDSDGWEADEMSNQLD